MITSPKKPDIFISYSHKDAAFARHLTRHLQRMTGRVWIDVDKIRTGKDWSNEIQTALDECKALVLLISPDAMASKNVEDEWKYCLDHDRPVIPILVRPTKNIHFQLNRLHYIDFTDRRGYEDALERLRLELVTAGIPLTSLSGEAGKIASPPGPPVSRQRRTVGFGLLAALVIVAVLIMAWAGVFSGDDTSGTVTLPTATPYYATLEDLDTIMPTMQEAGLSSPPFVLNTQFSGIRPPDLGGEVGRDVGLGAVVDASEAAAERDGYRGQVARSWDTGTACPDSEHQGLQINISLFDTPEGAVRYMNDTGIQQAWLDSGIYITFEPQENGILATGGWPAHWCGPVVFYQIFRTHGRFQVAAQSTGRADADPAMLIAEADLLVRYMIQKIDQAGME
ncbi:MAG: toll/interleukin-1 receptor domain-containing protein [Anaerolineae bacterium]|nr:toll/interleukin-1 receptor domain-containing protein [Anaerolineae bacterium]